MIDAVRRERDPDYYLMRAFPSIAPPVMRNLATVAVLRRYSKGEPLAYDFGKHAILVGEGCVEVRASRSKRAFVLQRYLEHEMLVLPRRTSGTVCVAVQPTVAVWVPSEDFHIFLGAHPDLLAVVLNRLEDRQALTEQRLAELALDEAAERVWAELQRSAVPVLGASERRVRFTQQQLADRVGSCRETVSRVLTGLMRQHKLVKRGGAYILPAPDLAATA